MALNNLAIVHMKEGRLPEAVAELEQALRICERANTEATSARGRLEVETFRRNLLQARGMNERQLRSGHGSTSGAGGVPAGGVQATWGGGWAAARSAARSSVGKDLLHKLGHEELQMVARRLGAKAEGDEQQLQQGIRAAVGGSDVNLAVQREMVRATFDALDLNGDGEARRQMRTPSLPSGADANAQPCGLLSAAVGCGSAYL